MTHKGQKRFGDLQVLGGTANPALAAAIAADCGIELTVCQMRLAVNALIASLSQPCEMAQQTLANAVRIIRYHQRRNAVARACHSRTRNEILQAAGIDMAAIKRCCWDTS